MTKIFGHRGSAGTHPENTMISFKEAARVGADGIELDVQLSKDGTIVVIHDETVKRTTNGKGWIKDLTLKEIKKLDASYKFKGKYGFCGIPTLDEVFEWAKTNDILINVELKNSLIDYDGLEEKTIALIKKYNFEKRVFLSSFNHYSMVKCHQLEPAIETALLFMEGLFEPWKYAKWLGAKAIHPYHPVAKEEFIKQSRESGISVRTFTVNEVKLMKKLLSYEIDAIITDYPEKAVKL